MTRKAIARGRDRSCDVTEIQRGSINPPCSRLIEPVSAAFFSSGHRNDRMTGNYVLATA